MSTHCTILKSHQKWLIRDLEVPEISHICTQKVMENSVNLSMNTTLMPFYCCSLCRNICHGSDSLESAAREIKLWFSEQELIAWTPACKDWIYE